MRLWMAPLLCATAILALGTVLAGCGDPWRSIGPYQDHVISGDADGVIIMYFGDAHLTIPLARQHCAQYEKVPDPIGIYDQKITYACIAPSKAPQADQHA
jgi:hypothetical protein